MLPLLLSTLLLIGSPNQDSIEANAIYKDISVGAQVGVNSARFRGDVGTLEGNLRRRIGFFFRGFARYNISNNIFLQSGIGYTQKGMVRRTLLEVRDREYNLLDKSRVNIEYKLDYIKLDFSLVYVMKISEKIGVELYPKGYIGRKVVSIISSNVNSESKYLKDQTSDYTSPKTEYGGGVGIAAEYITGSGGKIVLNLEYSRGVTNATIPETDEDWTNEVVSFGIGYILPIM